MAGIKNSIEIKEGTLVKNAPVIGRRAEVGAFPGSYLDEIITEYNPSTTNLTVQTTLVNGSKGKPLKGILYKNDRDRAPFRRQQVGDDMVI